MPAPARSAPSSPGCAAAPARRPSRGRSSPRPRSTRPRSSRPRRAGVRRARADARKDRNRAARAGAGARGVRARLQGKRVVICAGSGGVGKTTTSAALAMGLAASGLRVAVVTIDPAKRLANSLGLAELGNEPRLVDSARFAGHGIVMEGELWAMMLDVKQTFDELVARLAPDAAARDDVLGNRIYQQLSSAVAGSQEFTAVAKLWELDRSGRFDVLVLDTPPSRNALDFLDAPDRLTGFLEGGGLKG